MEKQSCTSRRSDWPVASTSQVGWVEQSESQRWNSLHSFQPTTALGSSCLSQGNLNNLDTAVKDGDEISIVPAIAGG
ncbi:MAG: MoaD/ThiS family protein [Deltaproteobacteria bacterium]|nr:MoaD/ThiS family protein [Deltaproteobacteria bacterium]